MRIILRLLVVLCLVIVSLPQADAAERIVARYRDMSASVSSGAGCSRQASVTVNAPNASAYTGDRVALQRLIGGVRAGLTADCPILREMAITGFADGRPAFQATLSADDGWQLPTGVDRLLAERRGSSMARQTAQCDHERNDPFVGCWVTLYPDKPRGTILNIRANGTWFWDTPAKLAAGDPAFDGKSIQRDYMILAGPFLKFSQKNGASSSMIGPYFRDDCNILKLDPYTPLGISIPMGIDEPHLFVRLRSPLEINANLLSAEDIDIRDGLTGNPGDAEIVMSIPDDGPAFNNCQDNFNEDIENEIILQALLFTVPFVKWNRLPILLSRALITRQIRPVTVIGRVGEYEKLAEKIGANYFRVADNVWDAMSPAARWDMNRSFLDAAIRRGDPFVLATPFEKRIEGSFFDKEIRYLLANGYVFNKSRTMLALRRK